MRPTTAARPERTMRHLHNGFSLLKMLVVVAMVGLFAGLALYGVRQSHIK